MNYSLLRPKPGVAPTRPQCTVCCPATHRPRRSSTRASVPKRTWRAHAAATRLESTDTDADFWSTRGGPETPEQRKTALARALLDKEAEIKAIFEPGRPMPKAAVVNRLRKEAASLRDELAVLLAETGIVAPGAESGRQIANIMSQVAATRARQSMDSMQLHMNDVPLSSRTGMDEAELVELSLLEAENAKLRARAMALLARQEFLEDQMKRMVLSLDGTAAQQPQYSGDYAGEAYDRNGEGLGEVLYGREAAM